MATDDERAGARRTGGTEVKVTGAEQAPDAYIEGYQGAVVHSGVVKVNA